MLWWDCHNKYVFSSPRCLEGSRPLAIPCGLLHIRTKFASKLIIVPSGHLPKKMPVRRGPLSFAEFCWYWHILISSTPRIRAAASRTGLMDIPRLQVLI